MADGPDLVAMTIEIVANYVAHNIIASDDVPGFIAKTHAAIKLLEAPEPEVLLKNQRTNSRLPSASARASAPATTLSR